MKKISFTFLAAALMLNVGCKEGAPASEKSSIVEEVETASVSNDNSLDAWADAPKKRIVDWVAAVTDESSADFIPVEDRIAVFDNDGTLWTEQPIPNQLQYTIDYLKAEYPNKPEWQKDPILSAAVKGDYKPLKEKGVAGLVDLMNKTHNARTEDEFNSSVRKWIDTTRSKRFDKPFTEMIYSPMVQLLKYLRTHDFKTFIVSGGGADFMRVWTEEIYGIPPYQVIGSYGELKYEIVDGVPTVSKEMGPFFNDDKTKKPEAIHRFIGKKPVLCGGNSDGDQAMMQYTSSSKYRSLCILLHHTDAEREFAYDTKTVSGHLESALVEAKEKNWMIVDMKNDFKQVFSFQ
ncbi:haloacid dehalogenase-like hydrolase [Joostella atrarenae]|uniref:Haloacid dehalogenase-like hydrolase n=1 Tax=Joostella atrarenae TaxID=679257 RepID=A0ABS9J546_9FLAO|nr:HAD family hydrolase [Joostella atrarenae]MCF8715562.1 haloacid dehalogenase-like hydrolase [Joostella atrarenae]